MNSCCSASADKIRPSSAKHHCPVCSRECSEVSVRTITLHLKEPWRWQGVAEHYYFCDAPACDVVYFGSDDSVVSQPQLRTSVGIKAQSDDALLCYCYGVTYADFNRTPEVRDYVAAQTKAGACACESSNPSGRCCLKDFPKA